MQTKLLPIPIILFPLLCICFTLLIISCRKDDDQVPHRDDDEPELEHPFSEIQHVFITLPNTTLGLMMHEPNIDKDVYYFGDKRPGGQLENLNFILVADREAEGWVLYELNENYLPLHIRLSEGYTLEYSNYNFENLTVKITGYETATHTVVGTVEHVPFDQKVLDWAQIGKQAFETDLRNARMASSCNKQKYNQAAAAYFVLNAAGCALGIAEFSTGAGALMAALSAYNIYQNCKSALGVIGNKLSGQPALDCPTAQDLANNALSCLEGELNAFSGNPYSFIQSCASGYLANAAAAASCNCDEDDDPPLGRSTGDPHIRTMDQLRYNFMAVGEFIALTSSTDNLEIQARQQDVKSTGVMSLNTGVAVRSGGDVLCVLVNPGRLYLNNVPLNPDFSSISLSGGNVLSKSGEDLTFTTGQGDRITIRWLEENYLLDYIVYLNPSRAGKVTGLLGNYDGEPWNDLVTKDGEAINGTFEELYPRFADSWRISLSQSLFFYEAGETTETFTDRSLPLSKAHISAEVRHWAMNVCQKAGVSDPEYLEDCIYDVAVTGDENIAASSFWGQKIDAIAPAINLPPNSDLKQFTNVRLEISTTQGDPEQINLIDFDSGQTYFLKDGAKHANVIDAIGYEYCSSVLAVPARIEYCQLSCGSGGIWNFVKDEWVNFNTGSIRYTQTTDPATNIPVEQWNNINSVKTLELLLSNFRLDKEDNFTFGAVDIDESNNQCSPQFLQNKSLYAFKTQEGKVGVFRVTANGFTTENRRWYTLDIKVQK